MNLHALGYDPTPGDPDAVLGLALRLGAAAADAETITARLRRVGERTGPQIWRGPAADAFHHLLDDIRSAVEQLARSHREAQDTLHDYAFALDSAQDIARRADSDAAHGIADRDQAAGDRRRAAEEARAYDGQVRDCDWHLGKARATRLMSPDPVYQAQMDTWETQTLSIRNKASSAAAQARGQETTARTAESVATARVDAAMVLAGQAKELRDGAARSAVGRLDAAGRAAVHRNPITRALNWIDDTTRAAVTDPRFVTFLDYLSTVGEIAAWLGIAIGVVVAIVFGSAAALTIGLGVATVLGIITLLGTALGKGYNVRDWGDVAGAALDIVPGARPLWKLAGPVVRRTLPWVDRAGRSVVHHVDELSRHSGLADRIKRTGETLGRKVPALKVFTRPEPREKVEEAAQGVVVDSARFTVEKMLPVPPTGPVVTPLPTPRCEVPARDADSAAVR